MNCDYVQEKLSAFLDREESTNDTEKVLSHLYECERCQSFFNASVKLRSLANGDREVYPSEFDEIILRRTKERRRRNILNYRLNVPAYILSAAGVMLIIVSFVVGVMVQRNSTLQEMQQLVRARVVYQMPAVTVYPVMDH